MGITNSGEPFRGDPQDKAREFDALWESSKLRAEFRHGFSLEELKHLSSRLRRMAKASSTLERESGIRRNEQYSLLASSRNPG